MKIFEISLELLIHTKSNENSLINIDDFMRLCIDFVPSPNYFTNNLIHANPRFVRIKLVNCISTNY